MNSQKYDLEQAIGFSISQKEQRTDWELVIETYQQALTVLTLTTAPVEWAETIMRGQSLGDATVSDVVKGVVKLTISSARIPLP